MPATPVRIGGFAGGLNTYSDPTAVGDNECTDIQNFDVDLDGSLISRPPFAVKDAAGVLSGTGLYRVLGWYSNNSIDHLIVASDTDGATYARTESGGWQTVTATIAGTSMVQFNGEAYITSAVGATNNGGHWDGTTWTADANIPRGETSCIYKERMFVAYGTGTNANRIEFSNPGDFTSWNSSVNFFDVRKGDGQNIVEVRQFSDVVCIFKQDSMYVYSFDSAPERGTVRNISSVIGCGGTNCIIEYENSLYVYHESKLYQLNNWNFTLTNLKVPFFALVLNAGFTQNVKIFRLGDRLVVRYFDNFYVFGLRTGTWSRWITTSTYPDYFTQVPINNADDPEVYYGFSRNSASRAMYSFNNKHNSTDSETDFTCYVVTKSFDFQVPYTWKRLAWWGVDIISKQDLSYTVHPITYHVGVTYNDLKSYTYANILGTYYAPITVSIDVTDSLAISNTSAARMFIKLLKSLRFRQIEFKVTGTTDGTSDTGPFRIYNIVAFVDNKAGVSKQVN